MKTLASIIRHTLTYLAGIFVAWITVYLTLPGEAQAAADAVNALIEPLAVLLGLAAVVVARLAMPALNKIFRLSAGEGSGTGSGGISLLAIGGLGLSTAAVGMLPSCSALGSLPVRATVQLDEGALSYSSKRGLEMEYRPGFGHAPDYYRHVDHSSGK